MYLPKMKRMSKKTMSAAMAVGPGTRKLSARVRGGTIRLLSEDEDEEDHESQVDEVHGLRETHRKQEERHQATAGLRLARYAGDGLSTGEPVADRRADGAARQRQSAADKTARHLDRTFNIRRVCHRFSDSSVSRRDRGSPDLAGW